MSQNTTVIHFDQRGQMLDFSKAKLFKLMISCFRTGLGDVVSTFTKVCHSGAANRIKKNRMAVTWRK
eukprot:UN17916